jgi:hypothetical protein
MSWCAMRRAANCRGWRRWRRSARGRSTVNERFELARVTNVPRDPTWSEPGYQSYIPGTSVTPGAGDRDARRERYVPPATAGRIRDAAGRLIGDGRAERTGETDINDGSDHWADGRVSAIRAAFLLDAARAVIEAVRARAAQGRRDR